MTLFRVTEESRYQLFFNFFHPHFPSFSLLFAFILHTLFHLIPDEPAVHHHRMKKKRAFINIIYTSPRFRTEDKKEQHEHCLSPLTLSRRWVDWRLHILNWGVLMLFLDAFWLASWKAQDKRKKKKKRLKSKKKKKKSRMSLSAWTSAMTGSGLRSWLTDLFVILFSIS